MSNPPSIRVRRALSVVMLPIVLALGLATAATAAPNEGTPEQREACAPDAINLCQDTIPDVPKTEACMRAHLAQLSPKCRAMFTAATAPRRPAGVAPRAASPAPATAPAASTDAAGFTPHDDGLDDYRASIAKECQQGIIDPFTCKNTEDVLGMSH